MKFLLLFAILLIPLPSFGQAANSSKCEANINGFKIQNVYIIGDQYNAVVWAYKHLSEETCLTPVTTIANADAIVELSSFSPNPVENPATDTLSVSCSSNSTSTSCQDSTGNVMTVDCKGSSCTSYYGPAPSKVIGQAFTAWLTTRWFESSVQIYTVQHKLLWRSSDTKGDWLGSQWPDLIRLGTNSPVCKCGSFQRPKYKNFRHWASTKCGVEFAPLVSIDLKLQAKNTAANTSQAEKDEMVRNAREAASSQQ